jgi:hypothetical protein
MPWLAVFCAKLLRLMVIKPAANKTESECFMVTSMCQLLQLKKG